MTNVKPLPASPQVGEYFQTEKAGVVRIGRVDSFGDVFLVEKVNGSWGIWKPDGSPFVSDGNTANTFGPLLYKCNKQGERMEQEIDTTKEPLLLPRAVEWNGMLVCGGMMTKDGHNVRLIASPDTYIVTREQESDPVIADLCARVRALAKPWKSAGDLSVEDLAGVLKNWYSAQYNGASYERFIRDYCSRNRIKIKGA